MTPIRAYWTIFCRDGLQIDDRKAVQRLWYLLLEADIPDKPAKLYRLSRLADAPPTNGPGAWYHFFAAFSPEVMVQLCELAVVKKRLTRLQASRIEDHILRNTTREGCWDLTPVYHEEFMHAHTG